MLHTSFQRWIVGRQYTVNREIFAVKIFPVLRGGKFARLRLAGLRLKPQKCLFLQEKVPYLGYIVTRDGIMPDQAKTEKILSYPVPVDVTRVRQFLGLASYYRRFVPGFAKAAAPLHALLKKDAKFYWTEHSQESFDCLKKLLVTTVTPILAYPQFQSEHPFILKTDANTEGLGAVGLSSSRMGRSTQLPMPRGV